MSVGKREWVHSLSESVGLARCSHNRDRLENDFNVSSFVDFMCTRQYDFGLQLEHMAGHKSGCLYQVISLTLPRQRSEGECEFTHFSTSPCLNIIKASIQAQRNKMNL